MIIYSGEYKLTSKFQKMQSSKEKIANWTISVDGTSVTSVTEG